MGWNGLPSLGEIAAEFGCTVNDLLDCDVQFPATADETTTVGEPTKDRLREQIRIRRKAGHAQTMTTTEVIRVTDEILRLATAAVIGEIQHESARGQILALVTAQRAEALRTFARGIDLDAVAEEWQGTDGKGHWAAGNAASSVQIRAYDTADGIDGLAANLRVSAGRGDQE